MCRKRNKGRKKNLVGNSPKTQKQPKTMAYYSSSSLTAKELATPANENNVIQLDLDLLQNLCEIQSKSGSELDTSTFIVEYLIKNYAPQIISGDIIINLDLKSNLYITKGTLAEGEAYPCVVGHMDTVHEMIANRKVYLENGVLFAMDLNTFSRHGVGGDDRCGVHAGLELLKYVDKIKLFFPVEEEVGLVGSRNSAKEFFNDVAYLLQADRKGSSDFITSTNGNKVWSDEKLEDIKYLLDKYSYTSATGTSTDIGHLATVANVIAANISCGYFSPHSKDEVIHLNCFENCVNLMFHIINHLGYTKQEYTPTSSYASNAYTGGYGRYQTYGFQGYGSGYNRNTTSKSTTEVTNKSKDTKKVIISKNSKVIEKNTDICSFCETGSCFECPYYENQ